MNLYETITLIQKFPGALRGLLINRAPTASASVANFDEIELGAFIQDVAEDHFWVDDGVLHMSDGSSYEMVWNPDTRAWRAIG